MINYKHFIGMTILIIVFMYITDPIMDYSGLFKAYYNDIFHNPDKDYEREMLDLYGIR